MLAGLVAVLIVGFATAIASRRIGEREAIVDARTTALARAQGAVEPAVTDALITGQPAAVATVATVVESAVIDESLVRVKIWTRGGVSSFGRARSKAAQGSVRTRSRRSTRARSRPT